MQVDIEKQETNSAEAEEVNQETTNSQIQTQEPEQEEVVYTTQEVKIPEENNLNSFKIDISKYERNTNKQTTFANDSIFSKHENKGIVISISVDGSKHADNAFEILTKEFLYLLKNPSLVVIHIFNNEFDHLYNYENKKDTVIYNYSSKLSPYRQNSSFIIENRESRYHALEQVIRISFNRTADFLVLGYFGIKGPRQSNEELSKGISYALGYSAIPLIIVKNGVLRKQNKSNGYRWCFVMDKQYSNCVKTIRAFSELIHPDNDFVYGMTLLPNYMNFDINKREFLEELQIRGVKNFEYNCIEYKKEPGKIISNLINHELEAFDFVVIYNNSLKHKSDPESNENVDIIKKCPSNICIVNSISN